jgi:hypothetical protein
MITKYLQYRLVCYLLIIAVWITSCGESGANATLESVRAQARAAVDGQMAAVTLVGAETLQEDAPALWAISKAIANQPGALMLYNDCQHLAIFISQGGKTASGQIYYFMGVVDTNTTAIVDATRQLISLGIDPKLNNLEDMTNMLRARGFVELTATTTPLLLSTLRLAIGFLKSMGGTISEVLVVPTYMLTPDQLYPWVPSDWTPGVQ